MRINHYFCAEYLNFFSALELPNDISSCHILIKSLSEKVASKSEEIAVLLAKIKELEIRLMGWAVHDGLPAYESYPSKHTLCHAHLMRDYKALTEQGVIWAAAFTKYFERLYYLTDKGRSSLDKSKLKEELAK